MVLYVRQCVSAFVLSSDVQQNATIKYDLIFPQHKPSDIHTEFHIVLQKSCMCSVFYEALNSL